MCFCAYGIIDADEINNVYTPTTILDYLSVL